MEDVGLVFSVYEDPVLFPIASGIPPSREIRSSVIGALVAGANRIDNLTEPVTVHLTLSNNISVSSNLI